MMCNCDGGIKILAQIFPVRSISINSNENRHGVHAYNIHIHGSLFVFACNVLKIIIYLVLASEDHVMLLVIHSQMADTAIRPTHTYIVHLPLCSIGFPFFFSPHFCFALWPTTFTFVVRWCCCRYCFCYGHGHRWNRIDTIGRSPICENNGTQ